MRRDVVPVYFLELNIVGLAIHRYLPWVALHTRCCNEEGCDRTKELHTCKYPNTECAQYYGRHTRMCYVGCDEPNLSIPDNGCQPPDPVGMTLHRQ